jgi:hypothetical protein
MRFPFGLAVVMVSACSSGSGDSKIPVGSQGGSSGAGSSQGGSSGAAGAQGGASVGGAPQGGAGGGAGGASGESLSLPEVYPPVRAATPTALIADPSFSASAFRLGSDLGIARQALAAISLATAIQERFYSTGPTDLLRIVKALDDRVQGLDLNGAGHPCLASAPVPVTYALPAGATFDVKLQCLQHFGSPGETGSGYVGFGVVPSSDVDAGVPGSGLGAVPSDGGTLDAAVAADAGPAAAGANDFYLIEGQGGGNGGAYHIDSRGNVEAWIAVAERDIPANSQVIMHLWTNAAAGTLELSLAGSGVGFCAAHLKTNAGFLFVDGKTNAPPPPGTEQAVGTQYCDAPRSGCFDATDLSTDLGGDSPSCAAIGPSSFDIGVELDADTSADAGVNVVPADIYTFFSQMPAGVQDF